MRSKAIEAAQAVRAVDDHAAVEALGAIRVHIDDIARIVQARNGFQLIRIAVRPIPPPIAMPCLLEDDEVVRRRRRDAAPHTTEADHVCTKQHHPGAALVH
jgi:hypothetical protein